jgi:hypothetical protein
VTSFAQLTGKTAKKIEKLRNKASTIATRKVKIYLSNPTNKNFPFVIKSMGPLLLDGNVCDDVNVFVFSQMKGTIFSGSRLGLDLKFNSARNGMYSRQFSLLGKHSSITFFVNAKK